MPFIRIVPIRILAVAGIATFLFVAPSYAAFADGSASIGGRTDAFVEKARRVYPSDPTCNMSVVGEFVATN